MGVTAGGTGPLGNVIQGVAIDGGAAANTIGGTTAAAANVIAGNSTASISQHYYTNLDIQDAGTSNNVVEGNFIGTNASNAAGLDPSYTFGAFIGYGATNNVIGGTTACDQQYYLRKHSIRP